MKSIISEIASKRDLPADVVANLAEQSLGQTLSATLGIDAYATWDAGCLLLWRFCPIRGQVPIMETAIRKKVLRRLSHDLDKMLAGEVAQKDLEGLRGVLHTVVPGKIRAFGEKGVVAELMLHSGRTITAFCPAHSLAFGDVPRYGRTMLWYVSAINMRRHNRIEVVLSRRSKEYVAGLLRSKAEKYGEELCRFRVTKRIPGQYVEIEAEQALPQLVVLAARSELTEHIKVKIKAPKGES